MCDNPKRIGDVVVPCGQCFYCNDIMLDYAIELFGPQKIEDIQLFLDTGDLSVFTKRDDDPRNDPANGSGRMPI